MPIDYNAIASAGGLGKKSTNGNKKSCVDMSDLPLGKTNRKQRENKAVRKEVLKDRCEIPGCNKLAQAGPHHIIQRSECLIDSKFNLISLCNEHHPLADEFEIPQIDLFELVAYREKTTVDEILKTLSRISEFACYIDGQRVRLKKPVMQKVNRNAKGSKKEKAKRKAS